jgi:hypothetical protein
MAWDKYDSIASAMGVSRDVAKAISDYSNKSSSSGAGNSGGGGSSGSPGGTSGKSLTPSSSSPSSSSSYGYTPGQTLTNQQALDILGQQWNATTDPVLRNTLHNQANAIRQSMGLVAGVDYNPVSGASLTNKSSLIPSPMLPPIEEQRQIVPELIKMIPQFEPYQFQEFQYTPPNYSITADPSQTTFIPTTKAKDRWAQEQSFNADQAYKQYASNLGAYQQGYQQYQDILERARWEETAALEKARLEAERIAAEEKARQDAERWQKEYELEKRKVDYQTSKPYSTASSGGGGSATEKTSINQRATQQAIAQVWSYNSPEEAITAYKVYGPDMAAQGVDLSKVWNELKKRWPNHDLFMSDY